MEEEQTTIVIQRYLSQLARVGGGASAEPIIEALIDSSVSRLHLLSRRCSLAAIPGCCVRL